MGGGQLQSSNSNSSDNSTSQVKLICGNPEIIHFKLIHKRPVNFAIEPIKLSPDNNISPQFGGTSTYTINKYGDLLSKIILEIDLPQLNFPNASSFYWTYGIGNALIETVGIYINNELIEEHTGDMMNIFNELTKSGDEQTAYDELVGNCDIVMKITEKQEKLYVPLNFWFCRNFGLSFPLISLPSYSNIKLVIKFRKLDELICSGGKSEYENNKLFETKTNINIYNTNTSINCKIFADYVFIGDEDVRKLYRTQKQTYLIDYIDQLGTFNVDNTKTTNTYNITPTNIIKEIMWVHNTEENIKINRLFDYSHTSPNYNNSNNDTFTSAKLMIMNIDRFEERDATYFRKICNFTSHRKIPRTPSYSLSTGQNSNLNARQYIYTYSFAMHPEEHQPSGIYPNNINLELSIKYNTTTNTTNKQLKVFSFGYKILNIN